MTDKDDAREREISLTLPNTRRFGAKLRALRENYWERMGRQGSAHGPAPRMRLSALALIGCLREAGYPLSSGAYSEIEAGNNLPRDILGFLNALSACLSLSDEDRQELQEALAYDLVAPRLGELAQYVVRRSSSLGDSLRTSRKRASRSVNQLAHCLMEHGFTPPDMDAEGIAEIIVDLEQGDPWSLGDEWRTPFVSACGQCLGNDAKKDLVAGMLDDYHNAMLSADAP